MYNRYISQPDGSFEKKQVTESVDSEVAKHTPPTSEKKNTESTNRMIPFDMDSGDMLVFIMLLLINGGENEYNALLTLVFYLFL